jgi:hypothetical protein
MVEGMADEREPLEIDLRDERATVEPHDDIGHHLARLRMPPAPGPFEAIDHEDGTTTILGPGGPVLVGNTGDIDRIRDSITIGGTTTEAKAPGLDFDFADMQPPGTLSWPEPRTFDIIERMRSEPRELLPDFPADLAPGEWRRAYAGEGGRLRMVDGSTLEIMPARGGARRGTAPVAVDEGIDPAILAWASRWCVSVATLAAEGFMVYERDGFGDLQLVGVDPDCGYIDASGSLERLKACRAVVDRRGLAGLGFGLAASHGAPASLWSPSP